MLVALFHTANFQKLALENCHLNPQSVDAIAQNAGLQVSQMNYYLAPGHVVI